MTLPLGRGWLRSPNQPAPATSSAPDSAAASGLHTRWAASSPTARGRVVGASTLTAKAATRSPVAPRAGPGELRRGLGPAAPAGGGGVGERHQPDGRSAPAAWSATARAQPASAWMLVDDARRARRAPAPTRSSPVAGAAAGEGDDDGVERAGRSTADASASAAPPKPAATVAERHGVHVTPRASSAAVTAAASVGAVGDDRARAHRRRPGGRRRRLVEDGPNRGLLPPPLAWLASAGASAPAVTASSTCGQRGRRRRCAPPRAAGAGRSPPPRTRRRRTPGRCTTRGPRRRGGRRAGRARSGSGIEPSESPPRGRAPSRRRWPAGPLERGGDHAGHGDRRHGVDDDAGRRVPAELPGERRRRPAWRSRTRRRRPAATPSRR